MPLPFLSPGVAATAGKFLLKALPWILMFSIGFAVCEAYEHRAPWGLQAKRMAAIKELGEVRQQRDDWKSAAAGWEKNRNGWFDYAGRLEKERGDRNLEAANEVGRCSASATATSSRAFDNGYAAGRAAGRKSCGATNANDPAAGPGQPGPGGVQPTGQTFSGSWAAGAYRPAAPVRPDH